MAIKFIVDSASDITTSEARELGIICVPLTVLFGEEEFYDSVNLTHKQFYEKLVESNVMPVTSQVTPSRFAEAFEEATKEGDTAVVITLSSKLSGTYQSAVIAAKEYEGKVFVVDSNNVAVGARVLVKRALELRDKGLSAEEIVEKLNEEKDNIRLFALLDTLEYLKKGGRISATVAFAGGLLSIKPIVAVQDGKVELVGKARGAKNGSKLLNQMIADIGGIDYDMPYALAYSGLTDDAAKSYVSENTELWKSVEVSTVGCVIGTHAGPGAIITAFFVNNK